MAITGILEITYYGVGVLGKTIPAMCFSHFFAGEHAQSRTARPMMREPNCGVRTTYGRRRICLVSIVLSHCHDRPGRASPAFLMLFIWGPLLDFTGALLATKLAHKYVVQIHASGAP